MTETFITLLISSITGVITYFIGLRKAKKELESLALDNISKTLNIYQVIIKDLKGEVETLLIKVGELEEKIDELKSENEELKKMVEKCGKTTKPKKQES